MNDSVENQESFEDPLPAPNSRPWRRRIIKIGLFLLGPLIPILGFYFYNRFLADRELQEAIAEVDRLDPKWRLEDLLAQREPIPAGQNSAVIVLAAERLLPRNWFSKVIGKLDDFPPPVQLPADVEKALRKELQPLGAAVAEARKLAKFPRGRFNLVYTPDFIRTLVPDIQKARDIAALLELDCHLRAQEGDLEGAWISAAAILNSGRSSMPLNMATIFLFCNLLWGTDLAKGNLNQTYGGLSVS